MRLVIACLVVACGKPAGGSLAPDATGDGTATEQQPDPAPGSGVADPPSSSLHDHGCAGVDWQYLGGWLLVAHQPASLAPSAALDLCVARYAGWVTREADRANVSRASVYAGLAATGQCAADHDYTGALISGAQCVGVHPGLAEADCRAQMAASRGFGIATLADVLGATAAVAAHGHDVPLMAAYLATGSVGCGGTDRWRLQAPASFVDDYVAAYNAYHARSAPVPACKKLIVMTVALYTGMAEPGISGVTEANGCWTYERVEKANPEWKICQYDGTVFHASGVKWAYDDTNPYNNAATESSRIAACATGPSIGGYVYMANRGSGWLGVTNTKVRSHFAELYSSQTAIDDQFATWKSAGEPGAPMINVGEPTTTAAQIAAATTQSCTEVPDQDWFGLYVYPQTLSTDRLSALVGALNSCTKQ